MLVLDYRIDSVTQPALSEIYVVNNQEFIKAVFGVDAPWAHVTSFMDDPADIQADRRHLCWGGDYNCRRPLIPNSNQYYTISTFYADDQQKARRRKALFRSTHVIVADDVEEKLPLERVQILPPPSFKLETSPGSQQWGWILETPCTERSQVENLLDGLVAQGLAPDGKDPGMKGVTRYVRLPDGVNTKASRVAANGGEAPRCRMIEWHPERKVKLTDLSAPFSVDLFAARREGAIDGAADIPDHPLLEVVHVKSVLSEGRFDITCPWVDEHTGQADDGAAVWTNADRSIGFQCHHGACQERTGADLLKRIEATGRPNFRRELDAWKVHQDISELAALAASRAPAETRPTTPIIPAISFIEPISFVEPQAPAAIQNNPDTMTGYRDMIEALDRMEKRMPETYAFGYKILETLDPLPYSDKIMYIDDVREVLGYTKKEMDRVMADLQKKWHAKEDDGHSFYDDYVYIAEQNTFYDRKKRLLLPVENFSNLNGHQGDNVRQEALQKGKAEKVDRIDYAPGQPSTFVERGITYANAWGGDIEQGVPGDVSRWLNHFDVLKWGGYRKHILQWMAFTLRHPEKKINHILLLGGHEGCGKDWLLRPLQRAMGQDYTGIDADELLRDFNDYLLSTKYLHINEAELGDRKEAGIVANKLKPLASAPPDLLRVNCKGLTPVRVRNLVNCSMTTNSYNPIKMRGGGRRFYGVWSDLKILDPQGVMSAEWKTYWADMWRWMDECDGWKAVVHYLMTQVDLSDFNPGAAPPTTEFVREIQQHNMDPVLAAVLTHCQHRIGLFKSDLLTAENILNGLKASQVGTDTHASLAILPQRLLANLQPRHIGKILRESGHLNAPLRARKVGSDHIIWAIREHAHYEKMSPRELHDAYEHQLQMVVPVKMEVVQNG